MSARNGYQHGVPCWVAALHHDPEKAVSFYAELFGWEAEDVLPPDSSSRYFMCKLRGCDVAAVGSMPPAGVTSGGAWNTHIWVDSADDTVAKAVDAGGMVVAEPFDCTMWLVSGYEGGEPQQPVSREMVGGMMPMSSEQSSRDVPPYWGVDFWVDDVDATATRALELGDKVIAAPNDNPVGRNAVLADPQGAAFSISKVAAAN